MLIIPTSKLSFGPNPVKNIYIKRNTSTNEWLKLATDKNKKDLIINNKKNVLQSDFHLLHSDRQHLCPPPLHCGTGTHWLGSGHFQTGRV